VKEEEQERDELEPSPPASSGRGHNGHAKRRRVSPGPGHLQSQPSQEEQAATTLESLRATTSSHTATQQHQHALSPVSSTGDGPTVLPPLTSFASRRRQSQNSAGADKASRLTIRPPPSPYERNQASSGGLRASGGLLPVIHSAPPAGWAQRQENARAAASGQSSAASSQFDHHQQSSYNHQQQQQPGGPLSAAMRLPVVPPVPNIPPAPRTAVPFARRPAPAPLPSLTAFGRIAAPRTAGLPPSHQHHHQQHHHQHHQPNMGPPALPTAGLSTFRTSMAHASTSLRDDYVQPIRTARPALGGGPSQGFPGQSGSNPMAALGFTGGGMGSSVQADRERAAFLAPFAAFYDSLLDARRLKGWLADQLRAQAPLEARLKAVERESEVLRRRVAELESNGGTNDAAGEEDVAMHEAGPSGAAGGRMSPQANLSAARFERPPPASSQPSRSAAPEPSPPAAPHPLPTPVPPKTPGLAAPPTTHVGRSTSPNTIAVPRSPHAGPSKSPIAGAGRTLSPPMGMLGGRISTHSPRAPTHGTRSPEDSASNASGSGSGGRRSAAR